jgi:Flp pilus assembly protein TadG
MPKMPSARPVYFATRIGFQQKVRAFRDAVQKKIRHFGRQQAGSIPMMVGLAIIPVMGFMGAAVDYSTANKAKAKLGAAADAAALAAVDHQAISGTASDAQTTAQNVFNAQATNLGNATVNSVSVNVNDSTSGRTAVVSYTATKPNLFMGSVGIPNTTINGSATASAGLSTYVDFYMLLDNTPSMGVGATPGDIATMVNNTPDQCAFACHDLNNSSNYYNLQKSWA